MPTVYIETSIPSFYFETRRSVQAQLWRKLTRRWWDEFSVGYDLVTSDIVFDELSRAPRGKAESGRRMLEPVRVLPSTAAVLPAARYYIQHLLVPAAALADALHLAFASAHGCDFLLTWNCQHLANSNKARHIAVLNKRLGLPAPVVCTPLTLLPEQDNAQEEDTPT